MKRITVFLFAFICLQATGQKLPTRWDEITASD
jgi:creatinine amidohydrolase